MAGKYEPLEKYRRGLPVSQEDVTLTFTLIEQILNDADALPASAQQESRWWEIKAGHAHQGRIVCMDASWLAGRYC